MRGAASVRRGNLKSSRLENWTSPTTQSQELLAVPSHGLEDGTIQTSDGNPNPNTYDHSNCFESPHLTKNTASIVPALRNFSADAQRQHTTISGHPCILRLGDLLAATQSLRAKCWTFQLVGTATIDAFSWLESLLLYRHLENRLGTPLI